MRRFIGFVALVALVVAVPATAFAGKGKGPHTLSVSSMDLVLLDSADDVPNWGEHVTFAVETTVTEKPFVQLDCFQAGELVYAMSAGFWDGYRFTKTYTLSSSFWTSGAADCVARLFHVASNGKNVVDMTMPFTVAA
jgi:hypothetical protein